MDGEQITTNFKRSEFRCKDDARTEYPVIWIDDRLRPLCGLLEDIRERWGGPLIIVSGYRTKEWNVSKGGAAHSQHMYGRAADIRPKVATDAPKLHALILARYLDGNLPMLGGLGEYPEWVHVDVRPRVNDQLARWIGKGIGSEVA